MRKGAFAKTIADRGDKIKIQFNHGMDPRFGELPLGRIDTIIERDDGLYVEAQLSKTSTNDDLIELINDGAIDGMSIRFSVIRDEWDDEDENALPMRTITEAALFEVGPVVWPAYEATSVGIRSAQDYGTWRGLNDLQRQSIDQIIRTGATTPFASNWYTPTTNDSITLSYPAAASSQTPRRVRPTWDQATRARRLRVINMKLETA
jgi:HK97 family phage prohead protease